MYRSIIVTLALLLALSQLSTCGDESTGDSCTKDSDCPSGFECVDGSCVEIEPEECQGNLSCNEHGSCDDSSGAIVCTCDQGYAGERCEGCAEGFQDYGDGSCKPDDPCAEDAACAAENRECENQQGEAVCGDCLAGYHLEGDDCVEDRTCQLNSCSQHGDCDDTTGEVVCDCHAGYTGDHCESCAEGYVVWPADSDTCVDDPCDPDPCDIPHAVAGGCVQTDVDQYVCACESGYTWSGEACVSVCVDSDQDGYGEGPSCLGADCNDDDPQINPGAEEICDDIDNDCDELTDEDVVPPDCPLPDTGVCQGAYLDRTCLGAAGWSDCDYGDDYQEVEDLCDGLDNDCDEQTDDGLVTRPCELTNEFGTCSGSESCDGANGWVNCDALLPAAEACNGLDDDCDGATDEDVVEPQDPCENEVPGIGTCTGAWHCQGVDEWFCDAPTPEPDICDGVDNNCDGITDEDFVEGGGSPYDGGPFDGDDGKFKGEDCGTGWCQGGTVVCHPDGDHLTCSTLANATAEICDGEDNDCDGVLDNGDPGGGGPCDTGLPGICAAGTEHCVDGDIDCVQDLTPSAELCDGLDNDCDPLTPDGQDDPQVGALCDGLDSDLCQEGTNDCLDGELTCSDNTGDSLDICDGADNDCDPLSNDGDEDPSIGTACDGPDSDLCQEGTYTGCAGGQLTCSDNTSSTLDVCDGADNDCDPDSADGSEDPLLGALCDGPDSDLCQEGTYTGCAGGQLTCSDNTSSTVDVCDGADNDCDPDSADGSEDPLLGAICDGPDSDLCKEGTYNGCVAAQLTCSDNTSSTVEQCNGVDDDCDDATDEDFNRNDNPLCSSGTTYLGSVSGDTGADTLSDSYWNEEWDRFQITEDDSTPGGVYLSATITLWSPAGTDYDLYVYCDNCGGSLADSSTVHSLAGHFDTVEVRKNDNIFGGDDFDVIVEIRHYMSNYCAYWQLNVQGNTTVSNSTCN